MRSRSGNAFLLMAALICLGAMYLFHRQAHAPQPPEPPPEQAPATAAPTPVPTPTPTPSPRAEQAPVSPALASRPPPAPPTPAPEPELPPMPVYTGMMKLGGQPMALFEGRGGALKVGDEIDGGVITAIEARQLTLRYGKTARTVPLNTDPKRYRGPPPAPTPPPRAWRPPPLPTPPPLPPTKSETRFIRFVPVTPPPIPTFAGSGSSR